jgi:hypothetical protein
MEDESQNVHPDFQPTSVTDVILRSTDKTLFYLPKARLICANALAEGFSGRAAAYAIDIVTIDMVYANAKSLALLLKYIPCPRHEPEISEFGLDVLLPALGEAYRSQINCAIRCLTAHVLKCVACRRFHMFLSQSYIMKG